MGWILLIAFIVIIVLSIVGWIVRGNSRNRSNVPGGGFVPQIDSGDSSPAHHGGHDAGGAGSHGGHGGGHH